MTVCGNLARALPVVAFLTAAATVVAVTGCSGGAARPREGGDVDGGVDLVVDTGADLSTPPRDAAGDGEGDSASSAGGGGGTSGRIAASDVDVTPAGGTVVLGTLYGSLTVGSHLWVDSGGGDLVVAAFDSARALLWGRRFGDGAVQGGGALGVDAAGNIVIATDFRGALDLDGPAGAVISAGATDVALARFDSQGHVLWIRRFGDAAGQSIRAIAYDGAGRVLAAAVSDTKFDFGSADPGGAPPGVPAMNSSLGLFEPESGTLVWSKSWPGVSISAVAIDSAGRIVACGSLSDVGDVNLGGGVLVSAGRNDIFVVVLNDAGAHLWSKRFGGSRREDVTGMAVDDGGNILLTGAFDDTFDFGGPPLIGVLGANRSYPARNVFVAKLDPAGNHLWSRQFGEPEEDQWGLDIGSASGGNVLVSGGLVGSIDIGQGVFPAASGTGFVLELDGAGTTLSGLQIARPPASLRVRGTRRLVAGDFPSAATFPMAKATWSAGGSTFLVEYAP